jgi:hypothetical protein
MEDRREDFPVTAPLNSRAGYSQEEPFTVLSSRLYVDVPATNHHRPVEAYPQGAMLVFSVDQSSHAVRFSVQHHLILGRPSPSTRADLIDLTLFDGYRYGVSRQHAMLWRSSDNYLLIEDLGSRNGTFIEGQRLEPLKRYLLNHDDRLQLGELFLRLSFEPASADASMG